MPHRPQTPVHITSLDSSCCPCPSHPRHWNISLLGPFPTTGSDAIRETKSRWNPCPGEAEWGTRASPTPQLQGSLRPDGHSPAQAGTPQDPAPGPALSARTRGVPAAPARLCPHLWKLRPSSRTTIQQLGRTVSSASKSRTYSNLLLAMGRPRGEPGAQPAAMAAAARQQRSMPGAEAEGAAPSPALVGGPERRSAVPAEGGRSRRAERGAAPATAPMAAAGRGAGDRCAPLRARRATSAGWAVGAAPPVGAGRGDSATEPAGLGLGARPAVGAGCGFGARRRRGAAGSVGATVAAAEERRRSDGAQGQALPLPRPGEPRLAPQAQGGHGPPRRAARPSAGAPEPARAQRRSGEEEQVHPGSGGG